MCWQLYTLYKSDGGEKCKHTVGLNRTAENKPKAVVLPGHGALSGRGGRASSGSSPSRRRSIAVRFSTPYRKFPPFSFFSCRPNLSPSASPTSVSSVKNAVKLYFLPPLHVCVAYGRGRRRGVGRDEAKITHVWESSKYIQTEGEEKALGRSLPLILVLSRFLSSSLHSQAIFICPVCSVPAPPSGSYVDLDSNHTLSERLARKRRPSPGSCTSSLAWN